jgi:hypothetical protein
MTQRENHLRAITRKQIAGYVEDALRGGELIMKEVWEEVENDDEQAIVKDEMRAILEWLEGPKCEPPPSGRGE